MRGSSRRPAREAVLRALYEIEVGRMPMEESLQDTLEHAQLSPELAEFAQAAIRGIVANREDLDAALSACLVEWDLGRVAAVDRNVLRMAAYELAHCPSIPPAVTINEAVDLAKKYSTAESGRFVNGVLGKLLGEGPKADWDPAKAPSDEAPAPPDPDPEVSVESVSADSPEAAELAKAGIWSVRKEEVQE